MHHHAPAGTGARRTPGLLVVGLAVGIAAIIGAFGFGSASSSATSFSDVRGGDHSSSTTGHRSPGTEAPEATRAVPEVPGAVLGVPPAIAMDPGAVTEEDGALPDGVTLFDDELPGVANLASDLLLALRDAATDAAGDGIALQVNSGWRSPEYQEQLLREAVAEYGSVEEASRWVATVNTSAHVSGDAVDIGPFDAMAWLSEHGARYGLCQIYRNEPWHYELRPDAVSGRCPRMYADSTHDPRMQQ